MLRRAAPDAEVATGGERPEHGSQIARGPGPCHKRKAEGGGPDVLVGRPARHNPLGLDLTRPVWVRRQQRGVFVDPLSFLLTVDGHCADQDDRLWLAPVERVEKVTRAHRIDVVECLSFGRCARDSVRLAGGVNDEVVGLGEAGRTQRKVRRDVCIGCPTENIDLGAPLSQVSHNRAAYKAAAASHERSHCPISASWSR